MKVANLVKPNRYQDSVTLMQVAVKLRAMEGMEDAALMMGTEPNKEMLGEAGLLAADGEVAGPNDLIVALRGTKEAVVAAKEGIEALLRAELPAAGERRDVAPHTLAAGLEAMPDGNLALISTPGIYAAAEARKALRQGRHVMIFSDNVSIEDELALKTLARERGLLMMGPDCGTAIIGGVPLGFANAVRRGTIGLVGASGTGMQEITSLVDRHGAGISHAIGTGSRDLSQPIGGMMTVAGLRALQDDPDTGVIVVVSKPPHPDAARNVIGEVGRIDKPVVVLFLGIDSAAVDEAHVPTNAHFVHTLEAAALDAVRLARPATRSNNIAVLDTTRTTLADRDVDLSGSQRYVRGLFSGGTFCYEAMLVMQPALEGIYSNTPLRPEFALPDSHKSRAHTCLDLGADDYTMGRPHPMIDMSARVQRIQQEAADPEVAVILLDVVLGYGAHPDPAGVLAPAIKQARERAASQGRNLIVVASICGTERDPQGFDHQRQALEEVGVIVEASNAAAARLAVGLCKAPEMGELLKEWRDGK